LKAHYDVERELAQRLRDSHPSDRQNMYEVAYSELFSKLPDHPQHKVNPEKRALSTLSQVKFLQTFTTTTSILVEVGCGDAAVTKGIAPYVASAIGIDVTDALLGRLSPPNFRFVKSNGVDFGLSDVSADVVYSNQLMEHLHPDDAIRQLVEIARILKPGGCYICSTPNRLTGPHDISGYFSYHPLGLHLREYDHASLSLLFEQAGFSSIYSVLRLKGRSTVVPARYLVWAEKLYSLMPQVVRGRLSRNRAIRALFGVILIGRK
ncbi:MAG TPA: class I SAM-dependent methyltransferase, partial [Reyranella sp.]|nr:class I SAM-dependent methyltransferase [Reyranella sp.]